MSYQSIDELQTLLRQEVFGDRQDSKKAAGRALGTFIETIVFYLLRQWGENDSIAIERPLSEYGREEITHNVEFTLHPLRKIFPSFELSANISPTSKCIANQIQFYLNLLILNLTKSLTMELYKMHVWLGKTTIQ